MTKFIDGPSAIIPAASKIKLPVISCDGCGACCMHMRTPPFMWDHAGPGFPDGKEYPPSHLEAEIRKAVFEPLSVRPDDSPCIWFDMESRQCQHYEHRPEICRDFEKGSEGCLEHRLRRGIS